MTRSQAGSSWRMAAIVGPNCKGPVVVTIRWQLHDFSMANTASGGTRAKMRKGWVMLMSGAVPSVKLWRTYDETSGDSARVNSLKDRRIGSREEPNDFSILITFTQRAQDVGCSEGGMVKLEMSDDLQRCAIMEVVERDFRVVFRVERDSLRQLEGTGDRNVHGEGDGGTRSGLYILHGLRLGPEVWRLCFSDEF